MLRELEHRWRNREGFLPGSHRREPLTLPNGLRQVLRTLFLHLRLWIEEVHLRRSTTLEQVDDALGLRRIVRERSRALELRESRGADGRSGVAQENAAVEGVLNIEHRTRNIEH